MRFLPLLFAAFVTGIPMLHAQAPGTPIEPAAAGNDSLILDQAGKLREAGKLMKAEDVQAQAAKPVPGAISLTAVSQRPLSARAVAEKARQGYLRVGFVYLCKRCDHWHLRLAGGYAIATDAAVTCNHVLKVSDDMREAYLIAVDSSGTVLPVTSILAANEAMDAAVLRIAPGKFVPLGLNAEVSAGDAAYCFSSPLGQQGYFSNGIVNRFHWKEKPKEAEGVAHWAPLKLNVSTDWAPGSSGAAVLDASGNAIGHVDSIYPLKENPPKSADDKSASHDRFHGATLITLHEAVPARSVLALVATLPVEAPISRAVREMFQSMKSTVYQHRTKVDRAEGSYGFDCVGMVSYALKRATPEAWKSVAAATGIEPKRIPSPPKYQQFFASLTQTPQPGWEAVAKISELQAGDIIAWDYKSKTAVGHAVVLAAAPVAAADGSWTVEVYDSTSSPHQDDTRPQDSRCQVMGTTTRPSGLGRGVIGLLADPTTGALTGYRWSPKSKAITAPTAAGRAVR